MDCTTISLITHDHTWITQAKYFVGFYKTKGTKFWNSWFSFPDVILREICRMSTFSPGCLVWSPDTCVPLALSLPPNPTDLKYHHSPLSSACQVSLSPFKTNHKTIQAENSYHRNRTFPTRFYHARPEVFVLRERGPLFEGSSSSRARMSKNLDSSRKQRMSQGFFPIFQYAISSFLFR